MDTIRSYIIRCKRFFIYAGVFSLVINLLTLVPVFYMLQVYDRVLTSHSNETLMMLTLLLIFMTGAQYYIEYIRSSLFLRTSLTMQKMMQKTVLECMLTMSSKDQANKRGLDDVHVVQSFFSGSGVQALFEIPWIPVYFFVMYLFHPYLALLALVAVLILVVLTYIEEKVSAQNQKKGQAELRKSQDFLDSSLRNLEVINAMSMRKKVTERWYNVHDIALSNNMMAATKSAGVSSWSKYVRNLLSSLALALAAYLAINDKTVTPGVMIAATMIMGRLMAPIDKVIAGWRFFVKARDAYSRLNKMLAGYNPTAPHVTLQDFEGKLSVEKLFFAFNPEKEILRNINFSLNAGESLGIIGNSAAGKTSLTRMLVGLHKPTSGAVRLDGAELYQWAQTGLLGPHIGYLPQSVELFAGSVAENISRLEDAVENTEAIIAAAKLAGAHDFILRLPKGYDTDIGDAGGMLSAGQRQLVGLARALYGSPKLVVLDEPNANLDGPSELGFMRMIRELKVKKITLVVVSHKPSVLRDIDKLLVLEQGRQLNFGDRETVMQSLNPSAEANAAAQVSVVKGVQA